MAIPFPSNEHERLAVLQHYMALRHLPHACLERVTNLAKRLFVVPYALISLVEEHHQRIIVPWDFEPRLLNREDTFCAYTILSDQVMVVCDAMLDPRFAQSPLVVGPLACRFYAAAPLITPDGVALGGLCILDTVPRPDLSDAEKATLTDLAAIVMDELETYMMAHLAYNAELERRQSAEQLQRSESTLRTVFESNSQAIILIDQHGIIQARNQYAVHLSASFWELAIQVGDSIYDYFHRGNLDACNRAVRSALAGSTVHQEINVGSQDGPAYWLEVTCKPITDDAQTITGVCLSAVDINQRKQSTEALKRSEERFRAFAQHSSDIITFLDAEGKIHYESPSVQQILGYPPGQRIGYSTFDNIHPDDLEKARTLFGTVCQQAGITGPLEFRYGHADGRWVYIESVCNNLLDDPAVGYMVVSSRDVTERKQSAEQLLLLQSAVQHTAEAIVITDGQLDMPGPRILFVNAGFEALTGYRAEEVLGKTPRIFQGPKTERAMLKRMRATLERGQQFQTETTNYRKDRSEYAVELSISPVHDVQGNVTHFVAVQRDITARKRADQLEEDRRQVLEMVAENQPLSDTLTRLVYMVEQQYPVIKCAVMLLEDSECVDIVAPNLPSELRQELRRNSHRSSCYACLQACEQKAAFFINDLGESPQCSVCREPALMHNLRTCWAVPIVSSREVVLGVFIMYSSALLHYKSDIQDLMELASKLAVVVIEQRQLVERLEHQAYHDSLTRLPNRILFEKRLQQSLTEAQHNDSTVALLFIDLDRFKQVNDTLGHYIGDQLLEQVALRLRRCIRPHDTIARMGGDEFALVMPQIADIQAPIETAQKILSTIQEPFVVSEHQLFLTANIGISLYPQDGTDAATLQRNADMAMYRTKRRGVSGYQYFTPDMNTALLAPLLELFELEEQMRKASIFDELIIHYQPQVDLKYGSLVGTEALLRWGHPKFGLIPPGKFIPVAERTGLIRPIGTWVLREVCRQAATWQRAGYPPIMVGVNVSAEQFAEPDFVQTVIKILRENNLEPRWLELELTESLMLSDFEMTARHLSDLKQLGVSIALDDFGVGHAVLSHLQRLPIDNLKIDRSFISDVALLSDEQSQHSIDLIQTILTLARKLRMRTVIEGIETQAQADLARHLNGDWAQGFWFGRPMPVQQFEQLFQHTLETRHTEPVD